MKKKYPKGISFNKSKHNQYCRYFISFKVMTCFGPISGPYSGHKRKLTKLYNVSHKISDIYIYYTGRYVSNI